MYPMWQTNMQGNNKKIANEFYLKGNEFRKNGDWQKALENYSEAIELDPESPAVYAKEMLEDILNYRCKALYNP